MTAVDFVLKIPRQYVEEAMSGRRDLFNFGWPQSWARVGLRLGLMAAGGAAHGSKPFEIVRGDLLEFERGSVEYTCVIAAVIEPPADGGGDRDGERAHPQYVGDYAIRWERGVVLE